jgi:hypothetical protein
MGSQSPGCVALSMEAPFGAAAARPTATARRARGVSPIGRRTASSAWNPSVRRTWIACRGSFAAQRLRESPAPSSTAVSPRECAVKASRVTRCSFPGPAPVRRGWCVTEACAAPRASPGTPRAARRGSPVRRASMGRPVFQTAVSRVVSRDRRASASTTRNTSASRACTGSVPRPPAPRESAATCGCPEDTGSSGARSSAIRFKRTVVPRDRSAA